MNKLIALFYFVLSLYGCDIGSSTFVHQARSGGADTLHSKVVAQPTGARFECVRSASGRCHFTVFPRPCAGSPDGASRAPGECTPDPTGRFAVADGQSMKIPGLRDFRVCVGTGEDMPEPHCETLQPIAGL